MKVTYVRGGKTATVNDHPRHAALLTCPRSTS